ncbi:MAG: hypothetical protein E2O82_03695 [Betaproteobacteria bacterium]|nr:MAG: hypothetical protein E2O82_03695 [Betaproteobacteria bacterium]
MALIIPVDNLDPAFSFDTDLEGVNYRFEFRLNERIGVWKYNIKTSSDDPIFNGVSFFSGVIPIINQVSSEAPPGYFVAVNQKNEFVDATRFNIGTDVKFVYLTEEDIEELQAAA